jgi:methylated-DNA-[protein]-cysteine S-methyltransferase
MSIGFAFFDTAIGRCAITWSARGILGVQLPEVNDNRTRDRLLKKNPGARDLQPPPEVHRACDAMSALLDGKSDDLTDIDLDMSGVPDFNRQVYEIARTIPPGETMTYGEIAQRLGDKTLSRAVGQALGQNPFTIVVPCHRVLAANGKTGGFSANGGVTTKFRMLTIERAKIGRDTDAAPMLFEPEFSVAPPQRRR